MVDQMYELLQRKTADSIKEGDPRGAAKRKELLNAQFSAMKRAHGHCYMIKFGEDDIRPMWEDQISIKQLRQEIKSPWGDQYDCPLCQPYDDPETKARRNMCRIVIPKYVGGAIDEEGVLCKCPCILGAKKRQFMRLKFKE